ncbi:MAG: DUF2934 domain-containing protein [Acetobacteraceae bacterium]
MTERLVDVSSGKGAVLHTFPITIETPGGSGAVASDADYGEKAIMAAKYARLVPDADTNDLTSRPHVSRGGALAPFGDDRDVLSQTKQSLTQVVRERAYLLWERDGCPHGDADKYWHRACEQHVRERAYVLWQQEGCVAGRADEHWHRTRQFESH